MLTDEGTTGMPYGLDYLVGGVATVTILGAAWFTVLWVVSLLEKRGVNVSGNGRPVGKEKPVRVKVVRGWWNG